jgi:hypothetical protein
LYAIANAGPNLDRFPRWMLQSQTAFMLLALAAPLFAARPASPDSAPPLAAREVALLAAFAATVCASYVFYRPFGRDEWTYLRFLLPAFPALLVLAVAVTREIAKGLIARPAAAAAAAAVLCRGVAAWTAREAVGRGALMARTAEQRYVDVGRFVAATLPANSVLIARLHAGSIRYYSHRLTMNYEWLEPRWLDEAVSELTARGYHPLIALEEDEEAPFRERFAALNSLALLDWPPIAERREAVRVRIYDPADRARFKAGGRIATRAIGTGRR